MVDYIYLEKYCETLSVLYVEDDKHSAKKTKELLDDIFPKVDYAPNGKEALDLYINYFNNNKKYYDLIITDINMPKLNGIELTKEIFNINSDQQIIVLSAHNETEYLLQLINLGISQFILKPIDYDDFIEIIYKISKVIYSSKNVAEEKERFLNVGEELVWDLFTNTLFLNDINVKLTKKEFLLISLLVSIKEKTFSNEEVLTKVWIDEDDRSPDIGNLKNLISRLRKKVPNLSIENVYGYGYRLKIS